MEAYELIEMHDGMNEDEINARTAVYQFLCRMYFMEKEEISDPFAKLKTEIMLGKPAFELAPAMMANPNFIQVLDHGIIAYNALSSANRRFVEIAVRDIWDNYKDRIMDLTIDVDSIILRDVNHSLVDIIDEYVEFKKNIDNVSPEAAAEVERLANMTDEEFEAEMNREDIDEEEEEEVDTPISLKDFNELSIAQLIERYGSHDTATCIIDAEGGLDKIDSIEVLDLFDEADKDLIRPYLLQANDGPTGEYDPDYGIPDEQLYPNKED